MTSIQLTNENEKFVDEVLAQGIYRSRDELLNEALHQLRTYTDLMTRIEERTQQLTDGRFLDVDQEGLKSFFDQLKANGHERASARNQPT